MASSRPPPLPPSWPASGQAVDPAAAGAAPPHPAGRRLPGWLVVAIPALAALAVGGYRLGGPSLWRDEAYTLGSAQRSSGQIFALLLHVDAVHGPYYLGMHVVVAVLGTSEAALRLPSLLATGLAAGITAALGRRLARMTPLPVPGLTGLLAGLLYAATPQTTFYAQDARPYGLVTACAAAATYLLLVALADGGKRWWAGYGAAIALTGMASLFALLLLAAHAVTLLVTRNRARLLPFLAAAAAAVVVLVPLIVLGYRQDRALGWISAPGLRALGSLFEHAAGSRQLIPLVAVLATCGVVASLRLRRRRELSVATVALPWLVLPPLVLLGISLIRPVYVERYVIFVQPALALLCAAGLTWLGSQIAGSALGTRIPALAWPVLAWTVPVLIVAVWAAGLIGPQQAVRRSSARPDNLRAVSAVVAANERPGDAVFFIPSETRVVSLGYPAPFRELRDLALGESPVASGTLTGIPVPAQELATRFAAWQSGAGRDGRVWVVRWRHPPPGAPATGLDREELALTGGMRLIRRWTVQSVVLSLYQPDRAGRLRFGA
jgi:mannosyltransferase